MADGGGQLLGELYWELTFRVNGLAAGEAQAKASLKSVEEAAAHTQAALGVVPETLASALTEAASAAKAAADGATLEASAVRDTGTAAKEAAASYGTLRDAQSAWLKEAQATPGTTGRASEVNLSNVTPINFAGSSAKAKQSGKQIADDLMQGIKEEIAARQVEINQQLQAGLITAEQATAKLRQLATDRNAAVLQAVDKAAVAGSLSGPQGGAVLVSLAGQLKNVEQASTSAGFTISRLRSPLATLATQAIGTRSSVGQLASSLGVLGVGVGVTLAVTAAAAAIGFAWDVLTEKAKAAAAKSSALVRTLLDQADAEKSIADRLKEQVAAIDSLRNKGPGFREYVAAALRAAAAPFQSGIGSSTGAAVASLNQGNADAQSDATKASRQAQLDATKATQETDEKYLRTLGQLLAAHKANDSEQALATKLLKEYRTEQEALQKTPSLDADGTRRAQLQGYIEALTVGVKADENAAKSAERLAAARKAALQGFDAAIAEQTPATSDNLETQIAKLTAAAVAAKLGSDVIAGKVSELRKAAAARIATESQALARDLAKQLVSETGSQAQQLQDALKDFDADIANKRSAGLTVNDTQVAQLRAAKVEAIALAESAERLQNLYQQIDDDLRLGGNLIRDMAAVDDSLATAEADKAAATARYKAGDLTAYRDIQNAQGRINTLLGEQGKLQQANQKHLDDAHALEHSFLDTVVSVSAGIADAANAAFGLASALGGADSAAAKLFGSIGQIGGGINSVTKLASNAGGFGALFSTGAGVASALPGLGEALGGAIALGSSLFAKSPEEQQKIQLQRENTQALKVLTDRVGDLAKVNVTGTTQTSIAAALSSPAVLNALKAFGVNPSAGDFTATSFSGVATSLTTKFGNDLNAALKSVGLSFQDFQDFAKQYGITIADTGATVQNVADVAKAIDDSQLTTFGDDFQGQTAKFNAAVTLLDLTTPIQQFNEFAKDLSNVKGGAGAFGNLLKSFDLTSPAGIKAATDALTAFFQNMGNLTPDQLGGLTGQDLLDAETTVKSIIKAAGDASAAASGTGGYNTVSSITEVTGQRMAALFSTNNILEERTATAAEGILARISGEIVPPISPPSISAIGNSQTTVNQSINVAPGAIVLNLPAIPPNADPSAYADAVKAMILDPQTISKIEQQIRANQGWAARSSGELIQ